jgi:serine phosphatase RsbU (regulator of sigma subunit)/tetratricopeptide (TPR) repeat protein
MNRRIFLYLILFFYYFQILSQNKYDKSFYLIDIKPDFVFNPIEKQQVDSILKLYHSTKNDSLRLFYIRMFAEGLYSEYLWTRYNKILYNYSLQKNDSLHLCNRAYALNNLGYEAQYIKNNLEDAKKYYYQSYEIFKTLKHIGGIGAELNNIAFIFQHEGNIEKSIEIYTEAGKYFEKQNLPKGLTSVYINLGSIYYKNDDFDKAEDFFNKALTFAKKTNEENVIANAYFQLGNINNKNNNLSVATNYFEKAYQIFNKQNDYGKLAIINVSLSQICFKLKDSLNAEEYAFKSLSNSYRSEDFQVKVKVYDQMAFYYIFKKNYDKAFVYADSSYQLAKHLNYPELIAISAQKLSIIFKHKNKYDLAYKFLYELKLIEDSIKNNAAKKAIIKSQYQVEYNKKEIELAAEQEKKDYTRKVEQQQQQIILSLTLIALLFISIFGAFAFKNYRKTKKQNLIIENQKIEVELKNEEITQQKDLVEEKQKEIIDSINYAQRIQQAVLTGEDVWRKISKDYFILFKPKDIVSGDFYWAYNTPNGRSIFALADCTGHGVPGGFMSMLGNSFLNEIVIENKLFKADEILNKLRSKIINALEQKGNTEQKDGMDIALCVWNKMDNTLEYAGANNPLWLVRTNVNSSDSDSYRNENKQFQEYKADKMPIGTYLEEYKPFTSTLIQLQKNDIIFLTTDGFADQFGGPKGKKMKYKPMIELLIHNSSFDMLTQKQLLYEAFGNWIGDKYEQIDDVSVIGIKI